MATEIKSTHKKQFAPTPDLNIRKEGGFVKGVLKKRLESKTYAGKFTYIIQVEDTNGDTELYDKEAKVSKPVDITPGSDVFLKSTSVLQDLLGQVQDGSTVTISYQGERPNKGRKATILWKVIVH